MKFENPSIKSSSLGNKTEDASDTFLKELEAEAKFYKIRGVINGLDEILENRRRKAIRQAIL